MAHTNYCLPFCYLHNCPYNVSFKLRHHILFSYLEKYHGRICFGKINWVFYLLIQMYLTYVYVVLNLSKTGGITIFDNFHIWMLKPKEVRSNHDVWWPQVFDNCRMFNLCTHSSSTCLGLVQHSVSPSSDPLVHPLLVIDQQSTVLNSLAIHLVLILFITFQTYPN